MLLHEINRGLFQSQVLQDSNFGKRMNITKNLSSILNSHEGISNLELARELKENKSDYTKENWGFDLIGRGFTNNPTNESVDNDHTTQNLDIPNGAQINSFLRGGKHVSKADYFNILLPKDDVTENFVSYVLQSEESLTKEIMTLPVKIRETSIKQGVFDQSSTKVTPGRELDITRTFKGNRKREKINPPIVSEETVGNVPVPTVRPPVLPGKNIDTSLPSEAETGTLNP